MLLSDRHIAAQLQTGRIVVSGAPHVIQPASIDVALSGQFRAFDNHRHAVIDPEQDQSGLTRLIDLPYGGDFFYVLHPGEFALGCTVETVTLPDDIAARLEGKSSLGRLGLMTHSTAGWIDPGFTGQVTLELSNVNTLPIRLRPGMFIGQLSFYQLSTPAKRPYGTTGLGSRYQDQVGATPSRAHIGSAQY